MTNSLYNQFKKGSFLTNKMKQPIFIFLLILPALIKSQSSSGISYQEGLDNCQKIVDENQKLYPDKLIYTGPDCLLGASVPEFSALLMDGKKISIDYFKGKITVLNFWMISCPPCIAEIPGFNNVVNKFGHDKLNYLAIGPDDEKDIISFLKNHPWEFSQLSTGKEIIYDVFKKNWGYPTTYVINEDGVIVAAFSGGKTDERAVKEIEDKLTKIITEELK